MSHASPDPITAAGKDAVILPFRAAEPGPAPARFTVCLLGTFEIFDAGEPVTLPAAAQRLVALLAVERRPKSRYLAASALWPDKPDSRATANLRSTLWRLNNCVDGLVESDGGHLRISRSAAIDIDDLLPDDSSGQLLDALAVELLDDVMTGVLPPPPYLSRSTASIMANPPINAELLADWDDEWVLAERERIRQQTLRALETAATELSDLGLFPEAIDAGTIAARLAPLRESAHRAIIEVHLAEGNYAEAVRQYETFRATLLDAFGVEPSPVMTSLFEHLKVDASS